MDNIVLALPKGRIMSEFATILSRSGVEIEKDFYSQSTRKLIFTTNLSWLSIVTLRSFDIATFVQNGACDVGICGTDVALEFEYENVLNILDLKIGICRLSCAKLNSSPTVKSSIVNVATKYPNITKKFFEARGFDANIIKLNGSIEISATLGLCDYLVDLVSTGKTFQENNIEECEKIMDVSSYLITNKQCFRTKNETMNKFYELISANVK